MMGTGTELQHRLLESVGHHAVEFYVRTGYSGQVKTALPFGRAGGTLVVSTVWRANVTQAHDF
jgi:hypothetical protein